jgi:Tetratricopeptide repeat
MRSLSIREQQLGADHRNNEACVINLALLYEAQGKYPEAQAIAQRALVICQTTLGNQHPNTQTVLLTVRSLQVQILLSCNQQTLFKILQEIALEAEPPELNIEVTLSVLEEICTNPELLHRLQEHLS